MNTPWLIPIDEALLGDFPPVLRVQGRLLVRKTELHLTVMNGEIRSQLEAHPVAGDLTARVERFVGQVRGALGARMTGAALVLADGEALTVAVRADVPEMLQLYRDLSARGLSLPPPVPHVTLFMAGTAIGIGVRDGDELARHLVAETSLKALLLSAEGA